MSRPRGYHLIWDRLDKVGAKHTPPWCCSMAARPEAPNSSPPNGAFNRKVPQIAFRPDWTRHAKAASFKRNDAMLAVQPIGVLYFPGSGIQDNLADKARKLGIPVWKYGGA